MTIEEMQKQIDGMMPTAQQIVDSLDKKMKSEGEQVGKEMLYVCDHAYKIGYRDCMVDAAIWLAKNTSLDDETINNFMTEMKYLRDKYEHFNK